MNEEQYLSRIRQLEEEIEYLHRLLADAGVSYELEVKESEDFSPERNPAFDEDQGARILPVKITKQLVFCLLRLQSSIFNISIICLRVEMMCIVRDPEKQIRRPENMVIIRNAGTSGRMEFAPRRIIHSSIVENVGTKDIRS